MYFKLILFLFFIVFINSKTFKDIKEDTLRDNQDLKMLENNKNISYQNELLSTKWKNIVFGIGANDLLLNKNFFNRSIEPMQTNYITLSQSIPMGNKLTHKKNINKEQTEIYSYFIKDKNSKLNSMILSFLNEYTILKERYIFIKKSQNNLKHIISIQKSKFRLINIEQIDIIKNQNRYLKLKIKKEEIRNKMETIKLKLQDISFNKIKSIKYKLSKMNLPQIDTKEIIQNNHFYIALKHKINKEKENIKYQKSLKRSDLKIDIGYYQREARADYIGLKLSFTMPLYGRENIKIEKSEILYNNSRLKLKEFENNFDINS